MTPAARYLMLGAPIPKCTGRNPFTRQRAALLTHVTTLIHDAGSLPGGSLLASAPSVEARTHSKYDALPAVIGSATTSGSS